MTEAEIRICIEDALVSYCRGVDRLHPASIQAAFHPGAMLVDYRPEPVAIEVFVPQVVASLEKKFVATQHRLSNIAIELDSDNALVEAYVLAYHVEDNEGVRRLHTFCGRYIDRFELRGSDWKIARRMLRTDWSSVVPMGDPMSRVWIASGRGEAPDPIFD